MNKPLVSIILTYYNHAAYVAQAVESVLDQTYPHLELIIINDESPDTPEFERVIAPYLAEPRLKLLNQPNQGVAASRNNGLAHSQGQYLCFLDSDDWLHPEKLARQVAILEAGPDLGMVYCDVQQVTEDGQLVKTTPMSQRATGPLEPDVFEALWTWGFFEPSTTLFRRELYEKAGPLTVGIEGHSDYEFWLRLSALGCKVRHLPEPLVYYRIHTYNYSKKTDVMNSTRMKARRIIMEKFPEAVLAQTDRVYPRLLQKNAELEDQQQIIRDQQENLMAKEQKILEQQGNLVEQAQNTHDLQQEITSLQTGLRQAEDNNLRLGELLVRYEQDLRALQKTLTVRVCQRFGEVPGILRKLLAKTFGQKT